MEQVPHRLPVPKYKPLGPQHAVQLGSRAKERAPRVKLSAENQKGLLRSRLRKAGQGAVAAWGWGVCRACPGHTATAFYGRLWEWQVSAEKAMTQD